MQCRYWSLVYWSFILLIFLAESLDSVSELPKSVNQQLQHLAKSRPKRTKTRAPSRTHVRGQDEVDEGGALDTFFRTGSATPSTTTPLISPNSDDRWLYFLWSRRIGVVRHFGNENFVCREFETLFIVWWDTFSECLISILTCAECFSVIYVALAVQPSIASKSKPACST